mmetsp:Transcript_6569/g.20525  ORF Transcript_6569/g.20525 Transcript_6569/m.20525 type:complete len:93 (+) Transcript_6569:1579-1857(+)|eukprot:scaffold115940_cov37-Tisochrysis_lutea.AAC.1
MWSREWYISTSKVKSWPGLCSVVTTSLDLVRGSAWGYLFSNGERVVQHFAFGAMPLHLLAGVYYRGSDLEGQKTASINQRIAPHSQCLQLDQ